jgi:hypothetical protein
MTQNPALKPGHVSVDAFYTAFSATDTAVRLCRVKRHTPRTAGGAHHMKRAAQKQNACISDN